MGKKSQRAIAIQRDYLRKEISRKYTHIEQLQHQSWCLKNDIKIWLEPTDWRGGKIIVYYKGEIIVGQKYFVLYKPKAKDEDWSKAIWDLYTEYYKKLNKTE